MFVIIFEFDSDLLIEGVDGELHESAFHDFVEKFVIIRGDYTIIFTHLTIINSEWYLKIIDPINNHIIFYIVVDHHY